MAPELSELGQLEYHSNEKYEQHGILIHLEQTLFVLYGIGLVGLRNKAPHIINVDDTVWITPNDEHWHVATKEYSMKQIVISETMNGQVANWLEQVLDIDYNI